MKVENKVNPNEEQMAGFLEGDVDSPIDMVNLLKFKEKAEYEDGRETDLSGEEAYAIYGLEVMEHLKKVGAESVFFWQSRTPNARGSRRALGYGGYC